MVANLLDRDVNVLSGKVLSLERGAGIQNVVVVAYDVDVKEYDEFATTEIPESVGPSFWASFPGQRLGSVITDHLGQFKLSYQGDLLEKDEPRGEIRRPDLVLFVVAPEDTATLAHGLPAPHAVRERILHYSYEVRLNAGRAEGYLIRIPEDVLAKSNIAKWVGRGTGVPSLSVLDDIAAVAAQRDAIRNHYKSIRNTKVAASREVASTSASSISPTMLSSTSATASSNYLRPGQPLQTVQQNEVTTALVSIPAVNPKRNIRFRLSSEVTRTLGFTEQPDGSRTGRISSDAVNERYRSRLTGGALLRGGTVLDRCVAKRDAERMVAKLVESTAVTEEPTPSLGGGVLPYDLDTVLDNVLGELDEPLDDMPNTIQGRHTDESLRTFVESLQLRTGPADTPSLHEFHDVQLAMQHVWTELFDQEVEKAGEQLYQEVVRVEDDLGLSRYSDTIESLSDLNALQRHATDLDAETAQFDDVPDDISEIVEGITSAEWSILDDSMRSRLEQMSAQIAGLLIAALFDPDAAAAEIEKVRTQARNIVDAAVESAVQSQSLSRGRLGRILYELERRLAEPYKFDVFAEDSVNFGLLVTYHQIWTPISYQVGDLVKTIPLAPGEKKSYTVKRIEKQRRNIKEIENSLQVRKEENENKGRLEVEIVDKAQRKTNFKTSAEASVSVGIFGSKASFGADISSESSSSATKKNFRESVKKAAEEFKQEHKLEVETNVSSELEVTESGEIINSNQELPVTYLFYELQRRVAISEQLVRVEPMVLVANKVPAPHDIDEDFLIAHDWILRRAILDDQYLPAFDYLSEDILGDEFAVEILKQDMADKRKILNNLRALVVPLTDELDAARKAVDYAVEYLVLKVRDDDDEKISGARISEESAREGAEAVQRELSAMKGDIERAASELGAATDRYVEALRSHLNRRAEIARLRVHVKQNIMYYMQAIWDTEPTDQRFFRVYEVALPEITKPVDVDISVRCEFDVLDESWRCRATLPRPEVPTRWDVKLGQVADLAEPLGYFGNYTIFKLREGNYLTDYMAQGYFEDGLCDPDEQGNMTKDELLEYFACIGQGAGDSLSSEKREEMQRRLEKCLADPLTRETETVLPTDSLYIEALPGTHPVLEDYKLLHRSMDVRKVVEEVRHAALENVRLAERLKAGQREDPEVDKRIEISGPAVLSVTDSDGS